MSREDQEKEIGDIRTLGYVISHSHEEREMNPEWTFEIQDETDEKKKKKKRLFHSLEEDPIDYNNIRNFLRDDDEEDEEEQVEDVDDDLLYDRFYEHLPQY